MHIKFEFGVGSAGTEASVAGFGVASAFNIYCLFIALPQNCKRNFPKAPEEPGFLDFESKKNKISISQAIKRERKILVKRSILRGTF